MVGCFFFDEAQDGGRGDGEGTGGGHRMGRGGGNWESDCGVGFARTRESELKLRASYFVRKCNISLRLWVSPADK